MTEKDEKKEKVIHTRISEALEQELKTRASRLGVSVSNLVRNVLLHTFGVVEGMTRDSGQGSRSARAARETSTARAEEAEPAEPTSRDLSLPNRGIIGWQTILLHINAVCSRCNVILQRGSDAALAVTIEHDTPPPLLCLGCLAGLRKHGASTEAHHQDS